MYYVYNSVFNTFDVWKIKKESHYLIDIFTSENDLFKKYKNIKQVKELTKKEYLKYLLELQNDTE